MDPEERFDSPILVLGFRGHPINGFCYDIIHKGKVHSTLNVSRSDNMHLAYKLAFEDYKEAMKDAEQLYRVEKHTGTIDDNFTTSVASQKVDNSNSPQEQ